jgi:single-strand DNA-binding protein
MPDTTTQPAEAAAPEEQPVILTGRLVADPQLRHTATSGKPVTSMRIQVDRGGASSTHTVVVWGRQAEVVCQYLGTGRAVQVTGRLQERSFTAKDGSTRTATEVVARSVKFLPRETGEGEAA